MSSVVEILRSLFPNFEKARLERRRIRQRYRKNFAALDRSNSQLYIITTSEFSPEHLPNWIEKRQIKADHLIQKHGAAVNNEIYRFYDDDYSKVKSEMEYTVRGITAQNWLSILLEMVFIIFVVMSLSMAVYIGIAGLDTIASEISNLAGFVFARGELF